MRRDIGDVTMLLRWAVISFPEISREDCLMHDFCPNICRVRSRGSVLRLEKRRISKITNDLMDDCPEEFWNDSITEQSTRGYILIIGRGG